MSTDKNFQLNKVSRFIKMRGETFVFKRPKLNEYKEPIKGESEEVTVFGVYHEVNSQVTENKVEASIIRSKPQPRILCMPEEGAKLKQDDTMEYKGTHYKVVEAANLLKYDICSDVSLEVIEDGQRS